MMTISSLFIISLLINGVFGDSDGVKSVIEGHSVTLHNHLTELKGVEMIEWRFKGDRIAKINREVNSDPVYDHDERFTDRLKMNPQTGDLTITNITSELTGDYKLDIIREKTETQSFSVRVFGDIVSVSNGGSVTLHAHVTEQQTDDIIEWRFNGTRIARINRSINGHPVYEPDKRFTNRMKMNPQTGDLTITNITSKHVGIYHLDITRGKTVTPHNFSVSLSPKVKIVKERDSVSLHIDVTDEQRNDKIHWKIKLNNSLVAEIITGNGKISNISTPLNEERFRDRLKLDDQTGDLIIRDMKNEDSGQYEADVTIGSNTHTIHKTFSFIGPASEGFINGDGEDVRSSTGLSSGVIAGICVFLLLLTAAAGVVIYRHHKMRRQESKTGEKSMETNLPLRNEDASNGDVPPV